MTSRAVGAEFANPILEGRARGWSQEGCAATMLLLGMGGVEKEGELGSSVSKWDSTEHREIYSSLLASGSPNNRGQDESKWL